MNDISLRPYHGRVLVCDSLKELAKTYKKRTGQPYPYQDDPKGGRYIRLDGATLSDTTWLVWAGTKSALAHELCHVLLHTFGTIGHNPTEGDGEPFCYMLSQLMMDAGVK